MKVTSWSSDKTKIELNLVPCIYLQKIMICQCLTEQLFASKFQLWKVTDLLPLITYVYHHTWLNLFDNNFISHQNGKSKLIGTCI